MALILQLLNYWRVILLILSLLGTGLIGEYHGRNVIKAEWNLSIEKAKAESLVKERDSNKKSNEVANGLSNKEASIYSDYDVYIDSLLAASANNLPAVSASTCKCNAATSAKGLSNKAKRDIAELIKQADLNTAKLISCQEWIREQSK